MNIKAAEEAHAAMLDRHRRERDQMDGTSLAWRKVLRTKHQVERTRSLRLLSELHLKRIYQP